MMSFQPDEHDAPVGGPDRRDRRSPSQLVDIARAVLTRMEAEDWSVDDDEFWCRLRPADAHLPGQGWKLHVSATQLTAPVVLARVVEILVRSGTSFKFARGRK